LLAGGLMLAYLAGFASYCWAAALGQVVTEGGMAALIVVAAGGYGFPIIRRLSPETSLLGLRVATACGLGLWMFSTAMLILGSGWGLLSGWLWWAIVTVGVTLAAWQGRHRLEAWRPPARYDGRALLWVLIALAAGLWLAGATRAPGRIGFGAEFVDHYDVLEYHLQVPREFHNAGRIIQLKHNCYSYYPLGVEMLFLMAMCLRGGAYEGMYLAKMLHGVFGALAVAAVFLSLKRDEDARGRFAAGLLATMPMIVYLSFLAMVELAEICYLALAVLWLREYLRKSTPKAAACAGLMIGASCAVKYLSIVFVAAPLLIVMITAAFAKRDRLAHLPIVGLMILLPFAPWLVRNTIYTRNPVFPLATGVFGKAHWSEESNKRWVDGHAPELRPPVPQPPRWKQRPQPKHAELFFHNFLVSQLFGPMVVLIALVAVATMIADRKRPDSWDVALVATAGMQLVLWAGTSHGMPGRFVVPVTVPVCLLAAGVLARLAKVQVNPFRKGSMRPAHGPWGLAPATVLFLATAAVGLMTSYSVFLSCTYGRGDPPWPGGKIAAEGFRYRHVAELAEGSKILMVGEARAFFYPVNTVYSTAFDNHPLAELAESGKTPSEIRRQLRRRGITHILVDWLEVWRLAESYGYPAALVGDMLPRLRDGRRPAGRHGFIRQP
jgi:hypothetical protein